MHYYLVKSLPKSFLQPEAVLTWVEHLTHTQKNCFCSQKLSLAERPPFQANQNLVVRLGRLFLTQHTKTLGLGGSPLQNESLHSKRQQLNVFWMSRRV